MRRLLTLLGLAVLIAAGGLGGRLSGAPVAAPASASSGVGYIYESDMYGTEMVPPVSTQAWGFVRFFFADDRSQADYTVDVKGVSGTVVLGADLRRGVPGQNGPVVRRLAEAGFIVTSGHATFTRAELEEMQAGGLYVTLYTTFHPDGEIRGQVVLPADFFTANQTVSPLAIPPGTTPPVRQPPAVPIQDAPVPPTAPVQLPAAVGPCLADCGGFGQTLPAPMPIVAAAEEPVEGAAPLRIAPPSTGDAGLR